MGLDFNTTDHPALFGEIANDSLGALKGMERVVKLTLLCFFAQWRDEPQEAHHVLLQATNGVAKSLLAANVNRALLGKELVKCYEDAGLRVPRRRVQGNPELMPSDLVGADLPAAGKTLAFVRGPLTADWPPSFMVLADEINRTGPRTMSGWLQAMAEGECTVRSTVLDETTLRFAPGWVLATQNPSQHVGTYPLPEAAYDRFMVMLVVGMTRELKKIIAYEPPQRPNNSAGTIDRTIVEQLFKARASELQAAKDEVGQKKLDGGVDEFIERICYWTWPLDAVRRLQLGIEDKVCQHSDIKAAVAGLTQGVSPRAAKGLRDLGCAAAYAFKKEKVTKDIIAELAVPVLTHRLVLRRSAAGTERTAETIVRAVVAKAKEA